ncbi:hypothetical protein F5Y05DRAFT_216862 [Hypoxylon sp. FL0543]|nr:hypothetical protein F5Y05DRAFT_216862 [Hypoxylon sp. FL0543]
MGLRSDFDLNNPKNRASWRHNRLAGRYHNVYTKDEFSSGEGAADSSALKMFLRRLSEDAAAADVDLLVSNKSIELTSLEIGRKIHDFMLKSDEEVDIRLTLSQTGLIALWPLSCKDGSSKF